MILSSFLQAGGLLNYCRVYPSPSRNFSNDSAQKFIYVGVYSYLSYEQTYL